MRQSLFDWCISSKNEFLLDEWLQDKNGDMTPDCITAHSGKKYWWRCSQGHEWQSSICNRTKGNACPYCSGKYAIKGVTDLQSKNPELTKEWHPNKNGDLKPSEVTSNSGKKIWWLGKCGHEWKATISDRNRGKGCPYCANRIVLAGFNDLETRFPLIAKEWNPAKNGELSPKEILAGSHKKVWWVCSNGHEWQAVVKSRTSQKTGCPYCSGRNPIWGMNDLETKYPELLSEWNFEKNGNLLPQDYSFGSNKTVWWKCSKGHEWRASITHRTGKKNTGCPICSNRKILPGFNDLATVRPDLVLEWNYEKNKELRNGNNVDVSSPDKVSPVSGMSVWWVCDKGHEWKAQISNRVNGSGCPFCSKAGTSVPEQGVSFYLEHICKIEQRNKLKGKEIDVYLPDYRIGIEYDGVFYHKSESRNKELEKDRVLKELGIQVIRIKESDKNLIEQNCIYYKFDDMRANYEWALNQLCHMLFVITGDTLFSSVDINVRRDILLIRERVDLYVKNNSVMTLFPEIAKEWNYDKNGKLTPDMFTPGSDLKVWWKCNKGHDWQTTISHRTSRGHGCPYCSGKRMLKGFNDFETWCHNNNMNHLLEEWDFSKNEKGPYAYSIQSREKVWWKCKHGHEWKTRIGQRSIGHGCPICNGGGIRRVKNVDTGTVFDSLGAAAESCGLKSKTSIMRCCQKQQNVAGGYHWEYLET